MRGGCCESPAAAARRRAGVCECGAPRDRGGPGARMGARSRGGGTGPHVAAAVLLVRRAGRPRRGRSLLPPAAWGCLRPLLNRWTRRAGLRYQTRRVFAMLSPLHLVQTVRGSTISLSGMSPLTGVRFWAKVDLNRIGGFVMQLDLSTGIGRTWPSRFLADGEILSDRCQCTAAFWLRDNGEEAIHDHADRVCKYVWGLVRSAALRIRRLGCLLEAANYANTSAASAARTALTTARRYASELALSNYVDRTPAGRVVSSPCSSPRPSPAPASPSP